MRVLCRNKETLHTESKLLKSNGVQLKLLHVLESGYHQSNNKNQLSARQVTKPVNDEKKFILQQYNGCNENRTC